MLELVVVVMMDACFLGGDFNCTANAAFDRNHPEPHGASKRCLVKLIEANDLCDVWRLFHTTQSLYTWAHVRDNSLSLARLDRFHCFKHRGNVLKSRIIHTSRHSGSFPRTSSHLC